MASSFQDDDDDDDHLGNFPISHRIPAWYVRYTPQESVNAYIRSLEFSERSHQISRESVNAYLRSSAISERSHQRSETTTTSTSSTHQVNIQILDFQSSSEPSASPVHYPRLAETFLAIAAQAALTLLTIGYSNFGNSSSLSHNAKILLHFGVVCEVAGFLCCLFAFAQKPGAAAGRTLTGVGCIATAYGFLAIMGMLLLDNLMLWISGFACLASFPALAAAFLR
ncbi:hypothetical protein OWV82_006953 [Melia azedarach]|uniref:Uncharacterized protein n=1 Tax=Melia azedarach TaxID=155640 RepID=A0ACC1YII9_MELAZ|nr:hypothetical protein OWV82_006953 [Melia azedarach]